MCEVRPVEGRGLGLVATRDIAPGEVVLSELPLLLYPQYSARHLVCRHCLRLLDKNGGVSSQHAISFCSMACASAAEADPCSQTPAVSNAELATDFRGVDDESGSALLLLLRIASLKGAISTGGQEAAGKLAALASLAPAPENSIDAKVHQLLQRLPAGHGLTAEDAIGILRRDAANAYGISLDGGETLRGTALLETASRLNHECMPNVARLDAFDAAVEGTTNTVVAFQALHAIPIGEELTQSYFPLNWDLEERQERCRELYGFSCSCPRCKVEQALEEGRHPAAEECGGADEGYVDMFLLKFSCPREECTGTMVPVSPERADIAQCNVCGLERTDAQFIAELEGGDQ